jgi:site-specific recombinase XerD
MKARGVYEREPGTGVWWIRYTDASGKKRREKVGPKGAAIQLVDKRRSQAWLKIKMPEKFRTKPATFGAIVDAAKYGPKDYRVAIARAAFADREADSIKPSEISDWLESHDWAPATQNRSLAVFKKVYRLAETNGTVAMNPARLVRMKQENNARTRYLDQRKPLKTDLDYLKPFATEEGRLRAVIEKGFARHMPEFEIALNTGMRRSEQYGLTWDAINLERRILTIPRAKNGQARHVPLNSVALTALKRLLPSMERSNRAFLPVKGKCALQSSRYWFDRAIAEAGIVDFHWHDLRHTFASRLVMAGVDLRTVQELMGHKTISMTVRYSHLAPEHQLAAVEKLVPARLGSGHQNGHQRSRASRQRSRKTALSSAVGLI